MTLAFIGVDKASMSGFQFYLACPGAALASKSLTDPSPKLAASTDLLPSHLEETSVSFKEFWLLSDFKTHPKSTHVTKLSEAVGKSASLVSAVQSHSLTFRKSPVGVEENECIARQHLDELTCTGK